MKTQLALLASILLVIGSLGIFFNNENSQQNNILFEQWKTQFKMTFDPQQEAYRKLIFDKNVQKINRHNVDSSQTFKMGINQFIIYEEQEFKERFLGEKFDTQNIKIEYENDSLINIQIDWTTKGGVSPIKNQGSCGSCWAFASVAACESWSLIEKKTSVSLSEQQLVDCSKSYGTHGCDGGSRQMGLKWIRDKGVTSQAAYPYKGVDQTCKQTTGQFHITTVTGVNGCTQIQSALSGRPIAVGVDAGGWSHYASGVFSNCGTNLNHAVLLVGVVNGAWKIKNSWGTGWGQRGFIRLAAGNTCGICISTAWYPH